MPYNGIKLNLSNNSRVYCIEEIITFPFNYQNIDFNVIIKKVSKEVQIEISVSIEQEADILIEFVVDILKFDMLFSGFFLNIDDVLFMKGSDYISSQEHKDNLAYFFYSNDEYKRHRWEFRHYFNQDNYPIFLKRWIDLVEDLDIIHQMFLYANANIGITVDLRFMLFVQCFQPLAHLLEQKGKIKIAKKEATLNSQYQKSNSSC